MPVIAGTIAALGSIGGAVLGANAQKKAARQQAEEARAISAQQTALNQPYMLAGNAALNPLFALYGINAGLPTIAGMKAGVVDNASPDQQSAAMGLFYNSPEYTIQKKALDDALMRSASARGTQYDPSTALGKAEIAGRAFGDWRNNLASLGQMGPAGANQQSVNLQNLGSQLGASLGNIGSANANLYQALGQTVGDIGGMFGQYRQYNQAQTQQQQQLDALRNLYSGGGSMPAPTGNLFTMPTIQRFAF